MLYVLVASAGPPTGFVLLTPADYEALSGKGEIPEVAERTAPPADAPRIEVKQPELDRGPVSSPLTIEVLFHAAAGAVVVPNTLMIEACVGLCKNVTKDVIPHAKLDHRGIFAEHAKVPPGRYKFRLAIADNQGRVGKSAFRLTVE